MSDKLTPPKEGSIEFAAFAGKKKKSEPDMRDNTIENNIFL